MKKLFIPFLFIACLLTAACSNDDDVRQEISCDYFEATTWDARLTGTQSPEPNPVSAHFVMQFLSKKAGKCIPTYGDNSFDGEFTYSINKDMITFNGSMVGNWTIKEHTNTTITLQSFQPREFTLVLTRM